MDNPWSMQQTAIPEGVSLGQQASQEASAAVKTSYPALPNDYGLGDTTSSTGAATSQSKNLTQAPGMASSHGFNPWSLMGESNARSTPGQSY